MNSILENKIREHAGEIFGNEPIGGHRERFAGKLAANNKTKRIPIHKIIRYLSIAAVFTGCIIFLQHILKKGNIQEIESLAEVQNYYSMQLQEKIDNIEQILRQVDENDRISLMEDIEKMQQEAEFSMQESDENNIAFVVMTYSSKIEALQHIYHILETNL